MNTEKNHAFEIAEQFVKFTNQSVFLTGKAGTGKTTFLKHIKSTCVKKMAIVAPTGIAAINAEGVTIHSLFQLPLQPFVPTSKFDPYLEVQGFVNQYSLISNQKMNANKRKVIRELELLVIDEISMVRADLLDAVDCVLRYYRGQPTLPFGGVQLLFIGDLYQLPPVLKDEHKNTILQYYQSPFFFDAYVLKDNEPIFIELDKIYRQDEPEFIEILNNIRNNNATAKDFARLERCYFPSFQSDEHYIVLTTHNAKADAINQKALSKIHEEPLVFDAVVNGDFFENAFPVDPHLTLKVGAKVMFVRNDKSERKRFYNGKIATISKLSPEELWVKFENSDEELMLEREVWRNVRYQYNQESDVVEEEELGSFHQYPLKLAWAITIHKSQGLTFEKAIVDAGDSFSAGQVYVALSRLTSLDGLVLQSKIPQSAIFTEPAIVEYMKNIGNQGSLLSTLEFSRTEFIIQTIYHTFDFFKVKEVLDEFIKTFETRAIAGQDAAEALFSEISILMNEMKIEAEF